MQHIMVQQVQQTCGLQEDKQSFIEEILTLRTLTEEAGVAGPLLEELEIFQHEVEHLDARAWERKEIHGLKRNELVGLSLAVLRAYRSQSGEVEQQAKECSSAPNGDALGAQSCFEEI